MSDLITSLAAAIQQFEGWLPGSVSQRNNNPGNLRAGAGQIGTDPNGYAIFPDYQTGWNALLNQVQLNVNRGLTLDEFFAGKPGVYAGYAPAADSNQPLQYADSVASSIGIDPTVPLNQIGGSAAVSGGGAQPIVDISGGAQPLVDLSGDDATAPTASILDQIGSSISDTFGLDASGVAPSAPDPTALLVGAVAIGAALLLVLKGN